MNIQIKKPNLKISNEFKYSLLISCVIPLILNYCSSAKVDDANRQASEAVSIAQEQSKQIERVQKQNASILEIVEDMAERRQLSKKEINRINELYEKDIDSSQTVIINKKRSIDELFRDAFKNAKQ